MGHGLGTGAPKEAGLSDDGLIRVDRWLQEVIDAREISGVVTLVARHGRIVHRAALGVKDLATCESMSAETIFRIFSMTKPVTAAAMMVLHDEGRWTPDDPIARHLPEFAEVKGPDGRAPDHAPTMRELMTHTAGFAYGIGPGPHDPPDAAYIAAKVWGAKDLADFSRRIAALPLAYQPGSAWRYSLSMDLQGAIIERLTGQSLPGFMRTRLFEPLGMVDTGFFLPASKLPRLATVYHRYNVPDLTVLENPAFVRDPLVVPAIPMGGGGLYSTIDDYARFAQMLLNKGELGGTRVLSPGAVELMTSNHLSDAIIAGDFGVGMQHVGPGRGYAFNGAVFYDAPLAGSRVGRGTYQWDGAAGTWFWVDPEHDLLFVGLIQRMMQEGMPLLQAGTQDLIADAIVG
ncbi:MAG TPA: serine hydrolase domain-containing protein [Caulobacteraceae bacterium]|jgi:CubicO group peptidase (beta-lactamase class C family)